MGNDNFYEVQQGKFLDDFGELAGRIVESGEVSFKGLNQELTKVYRDMTNCGQEYISIWKKDDMVKCAILENGGRIIMEHVLPPETSEILMRRFGKELSDDELDWKLGGVVGKLQKNADTLIREFAQECNTGGWKGLLGEIGRKIEEAVCQEMPEATGKIVVELEMPSSGTLVCYAGVKGQTAYIVYMDERQIRNAITAIEGRVEELYQTARKGFLENISQYVMELAGREGMSLYRLQEELLNLYRKMTAEVDVTDEIALLAGDGEVSYFLVEGQVISEKGRISTDVSGMFLERFGKELHRNAEELKGGWKETGK